MTCARRAFCLADRRSIRLVRPASHRPRVRHGSKAAASWSVGPAKLYTIGHSTRTLDDFIKLLKREGVAHLVDVRAFPTSARYPHFNQKNLAESLAREGIHYTHFPAL